MHRGMANINFTYLRLPPAYLLNKLMVLCYVARLTGTSAKSFLSPLPIGSHGGPMSFFSSESLRRLTPMKALPSSRIPRFHLAGRTAPMHGNVSICISSNADDQTCTRHVSRVARRAVPSHRGGESRSYLLIESGLFGCAEQVATKIHTQPPRHVPSPLDN